MPFSLVSLFLTILLEFQVYFNIPLLFFFLIYFIVYWHQRKSIVLYSDLCCLLGTALCWSKVFFFLIKFKQRKSEV